MVKVAILGFGTVGSGVYDVITRNKEVIYNRVGKNVEVKRILDLRKFEGTEIEKIVTDNFDEILADNEISIVIETMGGTHPALAFSRKILEKGLVLVTSNKEIVASHGAELMEIAYKNGGKYYFEASVGGGIPIIRPLRESLSANKVDEIQGIVNGTTNYILTRMEEEGITFVDALREAQEHGYAEKNPDADILGHDAARKLAIMISIATRKKCDFKDIYTKGIEDITIKDVAFAKAFRKTIKLVVRMMSKKGKYYAIVSPYMIGEESRLSTVKDVFNAISVTGNMLGEAVFYGRGAGKLPTASAVVADVLEGIVYDKYTPYWTHEKLLIQKKESMPVRALITFTCSEEDKEKVKSYVGKEITHCCERYGFISGNMNEKSLRELINDLEKNVASFKLKSLIRTELE